MSAETAPTTPEHRPCVGAGERRFVLLFGVTVMLITMLPYLFGFANQGEAFRFSGFVFGVEDGNSYIAKMLSGWAGNWLFRTPYSASPQNGLLIFLPYLLLGKLTSPPGLHEQLVALYHCFRIGAGVLAILASYNFIARFIVEVNLRRFALAMASLGGGLGWLLVLTGNYNWLGSPPLDFISPEAFGFLGLFGLPHLAMSRAMFLWALCVYLDLADEMIGPKDRLGEKNSTWRNAFLLSGLWLLAGLFNPLALVIVGVVILIHLSGSIFYYRIHKQEQTASLVKRLSPLMLAGLLPGIYLLYFAAISRLDTYASIWLSQNLIPSPNIIHFLIAYGVLIPYIWIGGKKLLSRDFHHGWLLVGWILFVPILVYLPFNLQRRLTEAIWVAMCVIAIAAFDQPASRVSTASIWQRSLQFAPLGLTFITSFFLLAGGFITSRWQSNPVFIQTSEAKVFQFLQDRSHCGEVVLAAYATSNAFPAWAPVKVLIGHGPESIFLSELTPQVAAFYQSQTQDKQRLQLIEQYGIGYVFWGPEERKLGSWSPEQASYLDLVERQGEFTLYKVVGFEP